MIFNKGFTVDRLYSFISFVVLAVMLSGCSAGYPPGKPPQVTLQVPETMLPGETYPLEVFATDADGHPLTYLWTLKGAGIVNATTEPKILYTVPTTFSSDLIVSIRVSDGYYYNTKSVPYVYRDGVYLKYNYPPEITYLSAPLVIIRTKASSVAIGSQSYQFRVSANDAEGDSLSYSWQVKGGGGLFTNNWSKTATFMPAGKSNADFIVTVTVSDGRSKVSESLTYTFDNEVKGFKRVKK